MNMNWLNIKYIGRAGLIIILLFFTCPSSATCKTDSGTTILMQETTCHKIR